MWIYIFAHPHDITFLIFSNNTQLSSKSVNICEEVIRKTPFGIFDIFSAILLIKSLLKVLQFIKIREVFSKSKSDSKMSLCFSSILSLLHCNLEIISLLLALFILSIILSENRNNSSSNSIPIHLVNLLLMRLAASTALPDPYKK